MDMNLTEIKFLIIANLQQSSSKFATSSFPVDIIAW